MTVIVTIMWTECEAWGEKFESESMTGMTLPSADSMSPEPVAAGHESYQRHLSHLTCLLLTWVLLTGPVSERRG